MKVALCFWGITRSLKYTHESIEKNVLSILRANNIDYTIYMHTFKLENGYTNKRTREKLTDVNNDEYKLLHPDYFEIDDQDEIKKQIGMEKYRSKPDPWNTGYNSVDNFILGQYSKSKIVAMIEKNNMDYNYVVYIRPDCSYKQPFNINFFTHINHHTICIPNFHLYGKYEFNDRFCIANMKTYKIYGNMFHRLLCLSKNQSLHAETILGQVIHNSNIKVVRIPFRFSRVRCDGKIQNENF